MAGENQGLVDFRNWQNPKVMGSLPDYWVQGAQTPVLPEVNTYANSDMMPPTGKPNALRSLNPKNPLEFPTPQLNTPRLTTQYSIVPVPDVSIPGQEKPVILKPTGQIPEMPPSVKLPMPPAPASSLPSVVLQPVPRAPVSAMPPAPVQAMPPAAPPAVPSNLRTPQEIAALGNANRTSTALPFKQGGGPVPIPQSAPQAVPVPQPVTPNSTTGVVEGFGRVGEIVDDIFKPTPRHSGVGEPPFNQTIPDEPFAPPPPERPANYRPPTGTLGGGSDSALKNYNAGWDKGQAFKQALEQGSKKLGDVAEKIIKSPRVQGIGAALPAVTAVYDMATMNPERLAEAGLKTGNASFDNMSQSFNTTASHLLGGALSPEELANLHRQTSSMEGIKDIGRSMYDAYIEPGFVQGATNLISNAATPVGRVVGGVADGMNWLSGGNYEKLGSAIGVGANKLFNSDKEKELTTITPANKGDENTGKNKIVPPQTTTQSSVQPKPNPAAGAALPTPIDEINKTIADLEGKGAGQVEINRQGLAGYGSPDRMDSRRAAEQSAVLADMKLTTEDAAKMRAAQAESDFNKGQMSAQNAIQQNGGSMVDARPIGTKDGQSVTVQTKPDGSAEYVIHGKNGPQGTMSVPAGFIGKDGRQGGGTLSVLGGRTAEEQAAIDERVKQIDSQTAAMRGLRNANRLAQGGITVEQEDQQNAIASMMNRLAPPPDMRGFEERQAALMQQLQDAKGISGWGKGRQRDDAIKAAQIGLGQLENERQMANQVYGQRQQLASQMMQTKSAQESAAQKNYIDSLKYQAERGDARAKFELDKMIAERDALDKGQQRYIDGQRLAVDTYKAQRQNPGKNPVWSLPVDMDGKFNFGAFDQMIGARPIDPKNTGQLQPGSIIRNPETNLYHFVDDKGNVLSKGIPAAEMGKRYQYSDTTLEQSQ